MTGRSLPTNRAGKRVLKPCLFSLCLALVLSLKLSSQKKKKKKFGAGHLPSLQNNVALPAVAASTRAACHRCNIARSCSVVSPPAIVAAAVELYTSDFRRTSVQLPSDVRPASLLTSSSCIRHVSLLMSSPCIPADVIILRLAGVIHLPSCAMLSCRLDVLRPRPAALTSYMIPYCSLAFYTLWSCILWSCGLVSCSLSYCIMPYYCPAIREIQTIHCVRIL